MKTTMLKRVLMLAGLLWATLAGAVEPIRIGVPGAYTGGSSPMGLSMRNGIRLAAQEINARGGVLGRPLQLVERDDGGNALRGRRVNAELIRQPVVATVGLVNTAVAEAVVGLYQEARVPLVIAVATAAKLTQPTHDGYVFRVALSDTVQARLIAREAVERAGYRRIAIFADTTRYGEQGVMELTAALARYGVRPVAVERFELRERDMEEPLRKASRQGAQVILTYAIGPELVEIANGMARMDWQVPLIGSWTLSMSNFIDNAGPNADGTRMVQTFIPEGAGGQRKAFIDAYLALNHGRRIASPPSAAQGYDAMLLLAAAIQQAGSTDRAAIRQALEQLKRPVDGVITRYQRPFNPSSHEAIDETVPVIGKVSGGEVVHAYREDRLKGMK
ncbi:amino acid/amide ABC transporter substrate-binding protein, HAAT family [Pseudogulbenkiania subflava DSM 22618]|uniref:Amino acid/amide ABC transporter substrate-binding protein, HAAT family n=2 Tax=Pseudogulbenkiania subflava TaxID=451637 RepID=A0A1Y6BQX8_9NEIS|nr:amino acid/amide ABC transporter substrate-binding protein, HAAT family [Pseudogulbenkiania subflava DSM 22618]